MPLVWDIFHASMNAKGGQLAWCCTTGKYGRGSQLSILEEEFNEYIFFFFEFEKLEYFEGIENFDYFLFFEKLRNFDLLKEFGNFYWRFAHWRFFL